MAENLPANWRWTTLENVAENQYGYTAKAVKNNSLPKMLRITDIQNGGVDWENVPNCEIDDEQKEKYLLQDNDIVIARTGSVGKSYLVKNPVNSVFASYLIRLRISEKINVDYVYYFLQSDVYWRQISELASGSVQLGVNSTKLQNIEIPVPPLAEQKRIVALLDNLFEKLDAAKSIVQKISDCCELRRAAILHRAFTGKLTENFRAGNGLTLEDWKEKNLGEILSLSKEKTELFDSALKYVGLENIERGGDTISFQSAEGVKSTKNIFYKGDLLYGKLRPYLNKHGIANFDGVCSTDILVFNSNELSLNKFINYFFHLPKFIEYAVANSKGINLPRVSSKTILDAEINLPPLEEQKELARLLDIFITKENRVKEIAEKTLQQIDALKKNILARAFRGELGTNNLEN